MGVLAATGCSAKKFAAKRVGNVFANSGTVYASDNDIELVGYEILNLVDSSPASLAKKGNISHLENLYNPGNFFSKVH
jgi:hypothetical protein